GVVFLYIGIIRFFDRKVDYWFIFSIYAAFLSIFLYFLLIDDNIWIRGPIISATLAVISFLTAHALFFWRPHSVIASANFSGIFFLLHGSFFVLRTILQLKNPANVYPYELTLLNVVTYIDALVCSILWTYVLIMMINQRLNADMRVAKEQMETIFNTSPDAAMISRISDGMIVYVNDGFIKASGFTREEVVGKTSLELKIWRTPHDREAFVTELKQKGYINNFEAILQRKDGRSFPGMVSASILNINNIPHMISVTRDITERKMMEEQLRSMSLTDELTGLYNRRGFFTLAEQQLKVVERKKKAMMLFYIDLNKMKEINDTLGHQEGDRALKDISKILQEVFRESDIIARIGGDEFAVLALETTEESEVILTKRLHNTLDVHNNSKGRKYRLSLSIGVAQYKPEVHVTLDQLMAHADKCMYEQKREENKRDLSG
ncbi:MAG: diguanylate cyclase, partial [Syntrophorhabdaceae bacterium]|nr:diguanylate cyclase [Syntrophorhabdaceae bacterium]